MLTHSPTLQPAESVDGGSRRHRAEAAIREAYRRGAVIGGTSAGAAVIIMGESVVVIYDARQASVTGEAVDLGAAGVRLHVLPAGATYDPRTGVASLPGGH